MAQGVCVCVCVCVCVWVGGVGEGVCLWVSVCVCLCVGGGVVGVGQRGSIVSDWKAEVLGGGEGKSRGS